MQNIKPVQLTISLLAAMAVGAVAIGIHLVDAVPSPLVARAVDIPLPGPAVRFDYQNLDPKTGLLYISHMDADHVVIFDTRRNRVVANIAGCPGSTGVLYVPQVDRVYSSASRAHEVVAIDARTRKIVARIPGIRFPDGIAYAPDEARLFVSDESGGVDAVIDVHTDRKIASIELGGEAGNTKYDPVSHRIFVNVQTRNQTVAIDPRTLKIVGRYDLSGGDGPHGMLIDPDRRIAYVACEDDAKLLVVDMRSMTVTATYSVGDAPDVLAFDPGLRRLYVACESGIVNVFDASRPHPRPLGEIRAPHAHTVAVDPSTHRVFLPLEDIHGHPVLRIITPPLWHNSARDSVTSPKIRTG